eukprot:TRINITY_DN6949_c0_g1_i2.p1 TRINITY_DN6949_c0_g1~~TRINITY_DN6949_c0_g1_i2.p1  ORF type:complete len:315 (+),score=99.24 TRINITY_DN6949_c0_g1_i2:95-1039(+)
MYAEISIEAPGGPCKFSVYLEDLSLQLEMIGGMTQILESIDKNYSVRLDSAQDRQALQEKLDVLSNMKNEAHQMHVAKSKRILKKIRKGVNVRAEASLLTINSESVGSNQDYPEQKSPDEMDELSLNPKEDEIEEDKSEEHSLEEAKPEEAEPEEDKLEDKPVEDKPGEDKPAEKEKPEMDKPDEHKLKEAKPEMDKPEDKPKEEKLENKPEDKPEEEEPEESMLEEKQSDASKSKKGIEDQDLKRGISVKPPLAKCMQVTTQGKSSSTQAQHAGSSKTGWLWSMVPFKFCQGASSAKIAPGDHSSFDSIAVSK